ncbi:MAG: hypothetical protein PHV18_12750 [Lachnospiraceae bacterium]|nr:hypothetical protein [Lachnospiraceae bacterium]
MKNKDTWNLTHHYCGN